eukprot:9491462-Ditylum_brightwellii.AAC.1
MTANMSGTTSQTTSKTRRSPRKRRRTKTSRIKLTKKAITVRVVLSRATTYPTMNQKKKRKAQKSELLSSEILVGLPWTKSVFIGLVNLGASGMLFSQQLADQCTGKVKKSNKKLTTQG